MKEKIVIMSLIIASFEDFLNENDGDYFHYWSEIECFLEIDKNIFQERIDYWSVFK